MNTRLRFAALAVLSTMAACEDPDTGLLVDTDTDTDPPAAPALQFDLMPQGMITKAGVGALLAVDFVEPTDGPEAVEFTAEPALEGLSLTPTSGTPSNGDLWLELTVTEATPVGEYVLTVTATATGYSPGQATLDLEVVAP